MVGREFGRAFNLFKQERSAVRAPPRGILVLSWLLADGLKCLCVISAVCCGTLARLWVGGLHFVGSQLVLVKFRQTWGYCTEVYDGCVGIWYSS